MNPFCAAVTVRFREHSDAWRRVLVLSYHDVATTSRQVRPDPMLVSTKNFVPISNGLARERLHPVQRRGCRQARTGGPALPEKAVLLPSMTPAPAWSHHVFTLLARLRLSGSVAPVTSWTQHGRSDSVQLRAA